MTKQLSTDAIAILRKETEWVEEQAKQESGIRRWYQGSWLSGKLSSLFSQMRDRELTRDEFVAKVQEEEDVLACGSTFCMAGHMVFQHAPERIADIALGKGTANWHTVPAEILGIDPLLDREAYGTMVAMFDAGNTTDMVRSYAEKLAGERL